jgi:hypothetical protein
MQLAYPWFLLGLLAVAIPVIIHLLQLRRPQRLSFTNTAFIKEVELVTIRHRKVQQLLILLARSLAVAFLVLVFCQPFIPAENKEASISEGAAILVDNSFSMQLRNGTQRSLFEEAVSEAKNLGQLASNGERIRLMNSGGGVLTQPAYQAKVDALRLAAKSPFSKMSEGIDGQSRKSPLYIFSDFQKSEFNPRQLDVLGSDRKVVLVPLLGNQASNVHVDSVWLDDAFVRVRTNVGLHMRIRNGGGVVATDCPVKAFLDDKQVAAFRVTVAPGQTVTSVVQVQVGNEKLALGRIVTEDAPVTFDNTYYFTLQPAAAVRILEIGSEPVTQQLYGNEPLFAYSFTKPQNINYRALRQANLVLVREVGAVDAGLRDGLRSVLKRGGSVVIVPSALPAGRSSYQQLFKDLGLGTVQWEERAVTPELREVAMPKGQEPFFRDVFGAQQRAVTMPRAAPVLQWSRTGTDLLRLRDGDSYLADFTSGTGRVYVFSAPFAKEYSDFVTHALYVPVMYRMAMLSYRNEQLPAYRLTQGTVTLQLPAAVEEMGNAAGRADEAGFRFVKDSLALIPAQRLLGQEVRLDIPTGMDAPGFYQVQRRGKVLTTLAFNQNKKESELAAYSPDELRQLIGTNRPAIRVLEGGTGGASLAKYQEEQKSQPLWRYFLALALACLLLEALLVRFGSRQATATMART